MHTDSVSTNARFPAIPEDAVIARGTHRTFDKGANVLEWLWLRGTHPKRIPPCARIVEATESPEDAAQRVGACPWTAMFVHLLAEGIVDADRRQAVCRPLLRELPGTAARGGDLVTPRRRSLLAFQWMVQVALPAVLNAIDDLRMDDLLSALRSLPPITGAWIAEDGATLGSAATMKPWYEGSKRAYDLTVIRCEQLGSPFAQDHDDVTHAELFALVHASGIEPAFRVGRANIWLPLVVPGHYAFQATANAIGLALWQRGDRCGNRTAIENIEAIVPALQESASDCIRRMMALRA